MAIAFDRYIDITSGLGAGTAAPQRQLIARLFTSSALLPTKTNVDFSTAAAASTYFGADTPEARRANFYFGFVSKSIGSPQSISFARWAPADTQPTVIGAAITTTLAQFTAVTAGQFDLTFGAITETVSGIDLSGAGDFATVASTIQTAVRAANADPNFATAVVTYDAANTRFTLVGGATGDAIVNVAATAATPVLADLLGWTTGARLSNGVTAESVTTALTESTERSNNFGSFAFVPTLTTDQITEAAMWNDGNNVLFQFHTPVTATNAAVVSAAIINLGGTGMTLQGTVANEYPEMLPMAVLAATNYAQRGAVQNYMFQQAGLTPTVTTNADADTYDALRVNYYGQTQTAGQLLAFYQRGFLTGTGTDPINMNVFANEQWLKDFAGSRLMTLLLSAPRVPANAAGRGQVIAVLRDVADMALINGTFSVGRTLTAAQRVTVGQLSGDPTAFQQVQTSGFWLDAQILSRVVDNATEFYAQYTLIYSKDDVIRSVEGSHVLI